MLVAIICPRCFNRDFIGEHMLPSLLACSACHAVRRFERGERNTGPTVSRGPRKRVLVAPVAPETPQPMPVTDKQTMLMQAFGDPTPSSLRWGLMVTNDGANEERRTGPSGAAAWIGSR